jgi:hypothetical protein
MDISVQNKTFRLSSVYTNELYDCPVREGRGWSRGRARPNIVEPVKDTCVPHLGVGWILWWSMASQIFKIA